MKKQFTLLIFCFLALVTTNAQNNSTSPLGASINLTTNGVGIELSKAIADNNKFIVRASFNYLSYALNNYKYDGVKGTPLLISGDIKLGSLGAYVDWFPFTNAIKFTGGLAYMMSNAKLVGKLANSQKQGEIIISPDEVGKINIEVLPNSIAPYLGVGYGKSIPKNRVGCSVELGVYYLGAPTVNFSTTNMLEPTSSEQQKLKDNLSDYRWLPKVSFNINFKLF